jgi:DNA-binding NarL/FixJ family response regulator
MLIVECIWARATDTMPRGKPKVAHKTLGALLIADDHEVFRFGLAEVLKAALGASRVESVGKFADALIALGDPEIALAIFDLRIPGLEDVRDLAIVRQRRPDLRLIVLSGSSSREDILRSLEAGVHGYIVKSEGSQTLIKRIEYVLSGEVYVPPCITDLAAQPAAKSNGKNAGGLTERQHQVLGLISQGLSNKAIAKKLAIASSTVKMHVAATFRAIGVKNRTQAAAVYKKLFS